MDQTDVAVNIDGEQRKVQQGGMRQKVQAGKEARRLIAVEPKIRLRLAFS